MKHGWNASSMNALWVRVLHKLCQDNNVFVVVVLISIRLSMNEHYYDLATLQDIQLIKMISLKNRTEERWNDNNNKSKDLLQFEWAIKCTYQSIETVQVESVWRVATTFWKYLCLRHINMNELRECCGIKESFRLRQWSSWWNVFVWHDLFPTKMDI